MRKYENKKNRHHAFETLLNETEITKSNFLKIYLLHAIEQVLLYSNLLY